MVALLEVTPPDVAVTVEVPTVSAVANPVDEMLATELGKAGTDWSGCSHNHRI